jgi:hypothetical protein
VKRFVLVLLAMTIVAAILPVAAMAHTEAAPYVTDLSQGRNLADVGDVKVWNDAQNVYVKIVTAPEYYLFGTKIEVKTSAGAIPQASGNAVPGKFTYKADQSFATEYTQVIPITWPVGTQVYIAAHAEAGKKGGSIADVCAKLPATVNMGVNYSWAVVPKPSYWEINVTGGTSLDGQYYGWCGSPHLPLDTGWTGPADVFCSYDPAIPTAAYWTPENLDSVNWVLNQDYVAKGTSWRVVQAAIWKLLSNNIWGAEKLTAEQLALVDHIVAEALTHDGFKPGCDEYVAIVLNPKDAAYPLMQPTIIVKKVPCYGVGVGTAWAKGTAFPGSNWSMYFGYKIQ